MKVNTQNLVHSDFTTNPNLSLIIHYHLIVKIPLFVIYNLIFLFLLHLNDFVIFLSFFLILLMIEHNNTYTKIYDMCHNNLIYIFIFLNLEILF